MKHIFLLVLTGFCWVQVAAQHLLLYQASADADATEVSGLVTTGRDTLKLDSHILGLRFENLNLPQGTIIDSAFIQLTSAGTSTGTANVNLYLEDTPDAATFETNFNNLSARQSTGAVSWSVAGWTANEAGAAQRTPDFSALLSQVLAKNNWQSGNSIAILFSGSGSRKAKGWSLDPQSAPVLEIWAHASNDLVSDTFPVERNVFWRYYSSGGFPAANWMDSSYSDTSWGQGAAALGYGHRTVATHISFGPDPASKSITNYFRKRFFVTDTAALENQVVLQLRVDDGCVIYLNENEAYRYNIPSGTPGHSTLASAAVSTSQAQNFFPILISKSKLRNGWNLLAVEVHQSDAASDRLIFDLDFGALVLPTVASGCQNGNDSHISCFTSIKPGPLIPNLTLPAEFKFQALSQEGQSYSKGGGVVPGDHDFAGFIGTNGSSRNGLLCINHENTFGGVSILDLHFDSLAGHWIVDTSQAVDFSSTDLAGTTKNCSGNITAWGTLLSCEEDVTNGDTNSDGYEDFGWVVEIDPVQKRVKSNSNGKQEKLWAMGRMRHENVAIQPDSITAYTADDSDDGCVYKFVADQPGDLTYGKLYVLKLDSSLDDGEPVLSTGTWVQILNTTQSDRNNTRALAAAAGGTIFKGPEDYDISPLDHKVYFASKDYNRVYRFTDNGVTVSGFETFVGGTTYLINYESGITALDWSFGNDNLTFDSRGNLYVLQDNVDRYIWMVLPSHTQAKPKVELMIKAPRGGEPTGMTLTPDEQFLFMSIQDPNPNNDSTFQLDAAGDSITFVKSTAFVAGNALHFASTPVPVTWLKFEGKRTAATEVQLNWATGSEFANSGFYIERSSNESPVFTGVGFVPGSGNSATRSDYTFADQEVEPLLLYYRLRQQDWNGKSAYSKVIAIPAMEDKMQPSLAEIRNISPDVLLVRPLDQQRLQLHFYDLNGKLLKVLEIDGENEVSMAGWPRSMYILQIINEQGEVQRVKVVR